jgi:hypothetical protein
MQSYGVFVRSSTGRLWAMQKKLSFYGGDPVGMGSLKAFEKSGEAKQEKSRVLNVVGR